MFYLPSDALKLTVEGITISKLKEEHGALISDFSCKGLDASQVNDEEDFLKHDAMQHQKLGLSETFLLIENKTGKLISYITLSFGSFKISEGEELAGVPIREKQTRIFSTHVPCLLIGKLATDKNEENRGGGTFLIDFAAQTGARISSILALPFMALHSRRDKAEYYKKRGFAVAFTPDKKDADTITMYRRLPKKV